MKRFFPALVIVVIALSACKLDSDVLGTYNGGKITRGELYQKIMDKGMNKKSFLNRKEYQKKELQMMAVDRIAVLEAKKNGYDKSNRFVFLFNDVKDKYLGAYLFEKYIKTAGFREKAVKVSHIVLKLKNNDPREVGRALALAGEIIEKLDKGRPFAEVAKKYSEDATKQNGGSFGYIIRGIFPEEYSDAAFALKKGDYTREPVHLKNRKRIFIIKADDITDLTRENIEDVLTNKKMAASYKKLIFSKTRSGYVKELARSAGASLDKKAVVFSIGDKKYTSEDIDRRVAMIRKISRLEDVPPPGDFKTQIAERYFTSELLKREALKQSIDKDKDYLDKMKSMEASFLAGDYMEYITTRNIKVTEKEMLNEYNSNKARYAGSTARDGKKTAQPMPYNTVKDMVKRSIVNTKSLRYRAEWINSVLGRYKFSVNEDKLEGN